MLKTAVSKLEASALAVAKGVVLCISYASVHRNVAMQPQPLIQTWPTCIAIAMIGRIRRKKSDWSWVTITKNDTNQNFINTFLYKQLSKFQKNNPRCKQILLAVMKLKNLSLLFGLFRVPPNLQEHTTNFEKFLRELVLKFQPHVSPRVLFTEKKYIYSIRHFVFCQ